MAALALSFINRRERSELVDIAEALNAFHESAVDLRLMPELWLLYLPVYVRNYVV